jgi:hypothetical protein
MMPNTDINNKMTESHLIEHSHGGKAVSCFYGSHTRQMEHYRYQWLMTLQKASMLHLMKKKTLSIEVKRNKGKENLRNKSRFTFLRIMAAMKIGPSTQNKVFHKILHS